MIWIIVVVVIVVGLIALLMESNIGKTIVSLGAAALGMLLMNWITDAELFVTLAKICGGAMIAIGIGTVVYHIYKYN